MYLKVHTGIPERLFDNICRRFSENSSWMFFETYLRIPPEKPPRIPFETLNSSKSFSRFFLGVYRRFLKKILGNFSKTFLGIYAGVPRDIPR